MFARIWKTITEGLAGEHSNGPACLRCAYIRRRIKELNLELDQLDTFRAAHLAEYHKEPTPTSIRRGSFAKHKEQFPDYPKAR